MAIATDITPYYRVEAFLFDAYLKHFNAKPVERASDAGAKLLQRIGPLSSAHTTMMRNLRLAFPNETETWRRDVARASWAELGRTLGEFPHLPEISSLGADPRIVVEGAERLAPLQQTGAVFIGGHFSNWETTAITLAESGLVCTMTYRPANNPIIDRRILDIRLRYGGTMQSAKGVEGGVGLARALRRKQSVALMNDQKYNEGVAAPFFGYDCMTADGPARLAHRYRTPLVPISLERIGPARFRVGVHEAIPLDYDAPIADAARDAVFRVNSWVEARVREAPAQWFWVHKRWPKDAWIKAGVM